MKKGKPKEKNRLNRGKKKGKRNVVNLVEDNELRNNYNHYNVF